MTEHVVLAVDGGNSKTDLALVAADGRLLAAVRGPGLSPHHVGLAGAVEGLAAMYADARAQAPEAGPAAVAVLMLAGADQPHEEQSVYDAVAPLGWAVDVIVRNDTFAVLRSGTDAPIGVAVVCGAGINCVGVGHDGVVARFASLGLITGDWGGGIDLGVAALGAAIRAEDGRGPDTALRTAVATQFSAADAEAVALDLHAGRVTLWQVGELSPLVLAAATDGDTVAERIVDRLATEVVDFARAALTRCDLLDEPVDVVLGGSVLRAGWPVLDRRIEKGLQQVVPHAQVVRATVPPVVGAALLGLDETGAHRAAYAVLRAAYAEDPR